MGICSGQGTRTITCGLLDERAEPAKYSEPGMSRDVAQIHVALQNGDGPRRGKESRSGKKHVSKSGAASHPRGPTPPEAQAMGGAGVAWRQAPRGSESCAVTRHSHLLSLTGSVLARAAATGAAFRSYSAVRSVHAISFSCVPSLRDNNKIDGTFWFGCVASLRLYQSTWQGQTDLWISD